MAEQPRLSEPATDDEWRALFVRWLDLTFHLRYGRAQVDYPRFGEWVAESFGWQVPERYR